MVNDKKEVSDKIRETIKRFEGISNLPTNFRLETTEGTFVFDEKTGNFVKETSPWMADNPRRWMADNSDAKDPEGTERFVLGAIGRPDGGADAYSQSFQGGKLVGENKDSFLSIGLGNNEDSSSSNSKRKIMSGEEAREDEQKKTEVKKAKQETEDGKSKDNSEEKSEDQEEVAKSELNTSRESSTKKNNDKGGNIGTKLITSGGVIGLLSLGIWFFVR